MKRIVGYLLIFGPAGLGFLALLFDGIEFFDVFHHGKRMAGLLGMAFLAGQFLAASRLPVLEQIFGQTVLVLYQRILGMLGLLMIFLHGFLDFQFQMLSWGRILLDLPYDLPKIPGMIAAALLIVVALPALRRNRLKVSYDLWTIIHRMTYIIFPLVLVHAFFLGTTIRYQPLAMLFWIFCTGLYVLVLVYRICLWIRKKQSN